MQAVLFASAVVGVMILFGALVCGIAVGIGQVFYARPTPEQRREWLDLS